MYYVYIYTHVYCLKYAVGAKKGRDQTCCGAQHA